MDFISYLFDIIENLYDGEKFYPLFYPKEKKIVLDEHRPYWTKENGEKAEPLPFVLIPAYRTFLEVLPDLTLAMP